MTQDAKPRRRFLQALAIVPATTLAVGVAATGCTNAADGGAARAAKAYEPTYFTKPESDFILAAVDHLKNVRLSMLALGAAASSALRFLEAYGLLRRAAWAEMLAALSGAIYVPFEIANLLRHFTWLSAGALVLNVLVVLIMVAALVRRRRPTLRQGVGDAQREGGGEIGNGVGKEARRE